MDQKIFSKFNFYDQIGYLMVGSIAIFILVFDIEFFYGFKFIDLNINNFIIWFVIVYFFGHLIQALTNIINKLPLLNFLIKENKEDFNDNQKKILKDAKRFFKSKSKENKIIWNVCYLYSLSKDVTGQIQAFNAYYSMYRGWLTVFLLESAFLVYVLFKEFNTRNLSLFLIGVLIMFIFYIRSKRFWAYLTDKVLQTYVIVKIKIQNPISGGGNNE